MTHAALTGGPAVTTVELEPTPAHMRRAMGSFASGVTVVTGLDDDEPVGFACQSFASVSLDPPLVLFCADHRGRSWPRIRRAGRFCVNVLGEEQQDLCLRFGSSAGARFEGLAWERSAWGAPALPGVQLRVHCEVYDVLAAGDHDIAVGLVLGLEQAADHGGGRPMLFHRGRFGVDCAHDRLDPRPLPDLWGCGIHWG